MLCAQFGVDNPNSNPPPLPGTFPPVTRTWYVLIAGQQSGPYPEEQLRDWVMRGQVAGDALICSEGMTEWVKAGEFFGRNATPGGRFLPSRWNLSPASALCLAEPCC